MKLNKHISRAEALKKISKYSALTATATFMLLSPKAAASESNLSGPDDKDDRPGSIWKD